MAFRYRGNPAWLHTHPTLGPGDGATYGFAIIPQVFPGGPDLRVIFSDASEPTAHGWEHVSVSTAARAPTWGEMSLVKRVFWDDEDCVVQFHPPKSQYVNRHPFCLHLWRHVTVPFPLPPKGLV